MLTHYIERDFEYKGYRCIVLVQLKGFRCGYVGVPPSHELYGVDCSISDFTVEIMCHGGITFADGGTGSIYPVHSDLWWIGFDCNHFMDGHNVVLAERCFHTDEESLAQIMRYKRTGWYDNEREKSLQFCADECRSIVDQIERYANEGVTSHEGCTLYDLFASGTEVLQQFKLSGGD